MIKIKKLSAQDYEEFKDMFINYFINDLGVKDDINMLQKDLLDKIVIKQFNGKLIHIDIIKNDNDCVGFIIYQIDSNATDWSERIGSGFIREFYIKPEFRRKSLGTKLLKHAENKLKKAGAKNIYLTSAEKEDVKNFYHKNGFATNHIKAENGLEYFEKDL